MHPDELMEQVNRLGERIVRDVLALVSQLPEKENGQGAAQSQEWMTACNWPNTGNSTMTRASRRQQAS